MAVGQLRQPAEPDHAQEGSQAGAERFGSFPLQEQHDGRPDADERDEVAHPADEVGEAGVDVVADRPQPPAPQGQGQKDAQGDQPDRPQVGGVALEDRRFRRGGRSLSGCLVRSPGGGLPSRGARRGRSALRRHNHSDDEITAAPGHFGGHSVSGEQPRRVERRTYVRYSTGMALRWALAETEEDGTLFPDERKATRHVGKGRLRRPGVSPRQRPFDHQRGAPAEPDAVPVHHQLL